jgi:hypothetical protein
MDARSGTEQATLEIDSAVIELRFSTDASQLRTNRGILDIQSHITYMSKPCSLSPIPSPGIFARKQRIVYGTERLLWLPDDYRPTVVAVHHNMMVFGCSLGRMLFLEFDVRFC